MTSRESPPETADGEEPDPLALSVDRLTGELRELRRVLDEIREDFDWAMRNDLRRRPIEYVPVKRMSLDPCAEDWGEKLEIDRGEFPVRRSAIDLEQIERWVDHFNATLEAVAEGRLEVILSALDGVRAELFEAIRQPGRDGWEPRGRGSEVGPEGSRLTGQPPAPAPAPAPATKVVRGQVSDAKAGGAKWTQEGCLEGCHDLIGGSSGEAVRSPRL